MVLDIDGNGRIEALTDGILTVRYLFGLTGEPLIQGAIAEDATLTTADEIEAYLESTFKCSGAANRSRNRSAIFSR